MKERVKNKGNEYVRGYLRSYVMTLAIASFLLGRMKDLCYRILYIRNEHIKRCFARDNGLG